MSMREMFHQSFEDRCRKYSFVDEYLANLKKPSDRFLIFVYHEKGLRNGGFGDRLGGLLTAFAHAIRFKRTLLMKASNGFYDYFQNYYPRNSSLYSWRNSREWSGYQVWKEKHPEFTLENREKWEYDLQSYCVRNWEEKSPEDISRRCAMDDGDVMQPVIRMASNRAYFCRWQNRTDLPSYKRALSALSLQHADDLWEASGCILRLLLWPTEKLWAEVDQAYFELLTESRDLFPQFYDLVVGGKSEEKKVKTPHRVKKKEKKVEVEDEYEFSSFSQPTKAVYKQEEEEEVELPRPTKKKSKKEKKTKKNKKEKKNKSNKKNSKKSKISKQPVDFHHRELRSQETDINVPTNFTLEPQALYQLGLHFRCGDIWSYRNLKLNSYGESSYGCTTDPTTHPIDNAESIIEDIKSRPDQKSQYLRAGFPLAIGTCARRWIDQGQLAAYSITRSVVQVEIEERDVFQDANSLLAGRNLDYLEFYQALAPYHDFADTRNVNKNKPSKRNKVVANNIKQESKYVVFITADNVYAAQQMRDPIWRNHAAEYLPVVVTPQGKLTDGRFIILTFAVYLPSPLSEGVTPVCTFVMLFGMLIPSVCFCGDATFILLFGHNSLYALLLQGGTCLP